MWQPSDESAQTEEKGRRRDNDDDKAAATDNVDSGFLSAGNMQVSAEIRDPGTPRRRQREDDQRRTTTGPGVDRRGAIAPGIVSGATIPAASPSSTVITPGVPARVIDSGVVDVDLSEGLNHLTLEKQRSSCPSDPLAVDSEDCLVRPEPRMTVLELSPVKVPVPETPTHHEIPPKYDRDDDLPLEQHRRDGAKKRAIICENTWQLYYAQDDDGDTQLHITIIQGFVEAALMLIRLAPHPSLLNVYNDNRQSPLHLAVLTNQSLIVRRLILAGADPSLRNSCGNTALHLACRNGDLACAKALTDPLSPMERNQLMPGQTVPALPQDLEQRNYSGKMCLHLAATKGHVNLVRLLLRLGADLEAREALAGQTALHLAMEHRRRSVVNFLLQECKPCLDTQTYSGLTAYQIALGIDIQLARELVRHGAKPEPLPISDSEGSSEDETYGETNYLPAIVKMQNAVEVKV
ncbi:NF-kappa-B inhibitor cactus [Monomorium pharaonis]|uniref:NF-kappa-B inhibitor cactus n=1 Tax=Monomorium pharaonis TaxID=307658 RepID=UPI00063F363C|nr:NF-kappa-B inhibitor cactus [Monomorium pharaonis]